jgi:hypothetical protein
LQLSARHAPHGDVCVARYLKYLAQARLVRALGDGQTLDGARPRAQGFEHGLDAEDVRAVVFDLRTARRLARIARGCARRGAAHGPNAESTRHTVAGRLDIAPVRAIFVPVLVLFLAVRAVIALVRVNTTLARVNMTLVRVNITSARSDIAPVRVILKPVRAFFVTGRAFFVPVRADIAPVVVNIPPVRAFLVPARVNVRCARRASARALAAALAPTRAAPVPAVVLHKLSARARSTSSCRSRA